jgi:predicted transcriptional regulator
MAESNEKSQITVRLPASLLARVDQLAANSRRTRSGQVVWTLEEYFREVDQRKEQREEGRNGD